MGRLIQFIFIVMTAITFKTHFHFLVSLYQLLLFFSFFSAFCWAVFHVLFIFSSFFLILLMAFLFYMYTFIYLLWAVLDLCCCGGFFSSCGKRELPSGCGAQASHCGDSSLRSRVPRVRGLQQLSWGLQQLCLAGFSHCRSSRTASGVVSRGRSCSEACGIFLDQGLESPHLLQWQADSWPLSHQGSPSWWYFCSFSLHLIFQG